jgi:hypothetical protein
MKWTIAEVWNEALETRQERKLEPRDYIWASELGGSFIDRYYKMKAVPPTNVPDARMMRKFEAGNMMEWLVGMVLRRAGLYKTGQEHLRYQYNGLLAVTGRLDFLAGGNIDWEKARANVFSLELPEFFGRATANIIDYLSKNYPDGLDDIILEVKSCSSFMFDKYKRYGADPRHTLQAFHYLKSKDLSEAHIVYISRDDLRLLETSVVNPSLVEESYYSDIARMTTLFNVGVGKSEKEHLVLYDFHSNKFKLNWKVQYSNYLTKIYGYTHQDDYDNEWKSRVASWNRVMTRCVNGDKMTPLNIDVIKDAKSQFPDWDNLVELAKNVVSEEDTEDTPEFV